MTRKDYQLIAAAFKARRDTEIGLYNSTREERYARTAQGVALAASDLARALKAENPRFDTARFLVACGVRADERLGSPDAYAVVTA